jgi:hypothetical protein
LRDNGDDADNLVVGIMSVPLTTIDMVVAMMRIAGMLMQTILGVLVLMSTW